MSVSKYMDSDRELQRVEKTINKLIQLQNKVKIRVCEQLSADGISVSEVQYGQCSKAGKAVENVSG